MKNLFSNSLIKRNNINILENEDLISNDTNITMENRLDNSVGLFVIELNKCHIYVCYLLMFLYALTLLLSTTTSIFN